MPVENLKFSLRNRWVRILGVATVMYMLALIDRGNLGMAIPSMRQDLGLSPKAIGLAAGAYFWGYLILQIPMGRIASLRSPKKAIFVLMLLWSTIALAAASVTTERGLTINRFMLGLAEGGLLTCVLVLIRSWFTRAERARATGILLLGLVAGPIIAGPLSGLILTHSTWRWMFIIEGLPGLLWGIVWWCLIDDHPRHATWMDEAEREQLIRTLDAETSDMVALQGHFLSVLWHPCVILLALYNFLALVGEWGIQFWYPTVLKEAGLSIGVVGLVATLPALLSMLSMTLVARSSDRWGERKWHMIGATMTAGCVLLLMQFSGGSAFAMVCLFAVATGAMAGRFGPFWTLPSEVLPPAVLGVGIGVIHGFGSLGGVVGPFVFGLVRIHTGNFTLAFSAAGVAMILGCLFVIPLRVRPRTATNGCRRPVRHSTN
ncbi:MFS transporter [Paraburkholderia sediminicola]|uniref:MFS transporter n=2 Tax=Burkholderiaceae TaxID=119060 RepID=UPI0038BC140E